MGLKKNKFYGRENDYGQKYHFYLKNLDGSAYDLTALTITFEAYLKDTEILHVTDTANVTIPTQTGEDVGHCYYEVQDGDFATGDAGEYWSRMKVTEITCEEVELIIRPEFTEE